MILSRYFCIKMYVCINQVPDGKPGNRKEGNIENFDKIPTTWDWEKNIGGITKI